MTVRFQATAGTQYHIAIDGSEGKEGRMVLRWSSYRAPTNDAFASNKLLSGATDSENGTLVGAGREPLEPAHAGGSGGSSVWYRWTAPATGSAFFSASAGLPVVLAVYTGTSVGELTPVTSAQGFFEPAYLRFPATAGTTYRIAVDEYYQRTTLPGESYEQQAAVTLSWTSNPAPLNDDFASGQVLRSASGSEVATNLGAAKEPGERAHAGSSGGSSVWFSWTATATGNAHFNTSGSSIGTLLAVYTGTTVASLTPVASDSGVGFFTREPSKVRFAAVAGTQYRIAVDGYNDEQGSITLAWSGTAGPATITVTSPGGGETWAPGSSRSVTWAYAPPPAAAATVGEAPSTASPTAALATPSAKAFDDVAAVAEADGRVRVIVGLNAGFRPEGQLAAQRATAQREGIAKVRDRVVRLLKGTDHTVARTFETLPSVVLELSPAAVQRLRGSPEVTSITEDVPAAPSLADSGPLVEAPEAWNAGFDGSGQVVAVLDTGVAGTHPFLAGKVVEEACYSARNNCPNGATSQTGPGSGVRCTYTAGCDHGTHVAGIAAGLGTGRSGVGRGASIMSVQVFSRFSGITECDFFSEGDPCTRSFPATRWLASIGSTCCATPAPSPR